MNHARIRYRSCFTLCNVSLLVSVSRIVFRNCEKKLNSCVTVELVIHFMFLFVLI